MGTHGTSRPTQALTSAQPDLPVYHDAARETADRAILGGAAAADPNLGDIVAARTETPLEAEIDAANGLRHHGGRRPSPEDFEDILTPEGNSGDIVGSEIEKNTWVFGEDGSTSGTRL